MYKGRRPQDATRRHTAGAVCARGSVGSRSARRPVRGGNRDGRPRRSSVARRRRTAGRCASCWRRRLLHCPITREAPRRAKTRPRRLRQRAAVRCAHVVLGHARRHEEKAVVVPDDRRARRHAVEPVALARSVLAARGALGAAVGAGGGLVRLGRAPRGRHDAEPRRRGEAAAR